MREALAIGHEFAPSIAYRPSYEEAHFHCRTVHRPRPCVAACRRPRAASRCWPTGIDDRRDACGGGITLAVKGRRCRAKRRDRGGTRLWRPHARRKHEHQVRFQVDHLGPCGHRYRQGIAGGGRPADRADSRRRPAGGARPAAGPHHRRQSAVDAGGAGADIGRQLRTVGR